jgi:hypothetical protein
MPSEAFDWLTRVRAVEREYTTVRLAMDRLRQHAMENPNHLPGAIPFRDINTASYRLAGTYVVRLFSEFETALKHFLRAKKLRVPTNAGPLINKVRDRGGVPDAFTTDVHRVREYRNTLVHDLLRPALAVSVRDSTKYLSTFLSWLQRTW